MFIREDTRRTGTIERDRQNCRRILEPYSTTFLFCRIRCMCCYANHIHGIIVLGTERAKCPRPPTRSHNNTKVEAYSQGNRRVAVSSPTLGQVVAYFKYQSTKCINQHRDMPGTRIWQRNYYDHVIRDDLDLQRIRQYITDNPMQWELDQLHPSNLSKQ